jgi:hypothetical protein
VGYGHEHRRRDEELQVLGKEAGMIMMIMIMIMMMMIIIIIIIMMKIMTTKMMMVITATANIMMLQGHSLKNWKRRFFLIHAGLYELAPTTPTCMQRMRPKQSPFVTHCACAITTQEKMTPLRKARLWFAIFVVVLHPLKPSFAIAIIMIIIIIILAFAGIVPLTGASVAVHKTDNPLFMGVKVSVGDGDGDRDGDVDGDGDDFGDGYVNSN